MNKKKLKKKYATVEEWRNSSSENEEIESKWKQSLVVVVFSGKCKV